MAIGPRVAQLRQASLDAISTLSAERANLLTDFYCQDGPRTSVPVQRALSFRYLLERKAIRIYDGELIVGEKGSGAKAAPTFPELCCHSLSDLAILDGREKIPFKVSTADQELYEQKIIPFWRGKSMRELIFDEMTPEWLAAYEAGIFTEFMEQRAPGHTGARRQDLP